MGEAISIKYDECPTNEFRKGESDGKCWGNGHYMCKECIHYRKDFKIHGQEYIDHIHQQQGALTFKTLR